VKESITRSILRLNSDLASLSKENACRPATDVPDTVCVAYYDRSVSMFEDIAISANEKDDHAPQRSENM
jgi:hypothetical protein